MVKKSQKEQDSTQINIAPVVAFLKKNKKVTAAISIAFLILIGMFFAVYYRAYTATLPVTDDWARDSVINNIRSQVAAEVNQQYPLNLPQDRKNALIEEQVAKILKENKVEVDLQTMQLSTYIKTFMKNDDGQTYLLEIDPYHYYQQTDNVLDHGEGYDEIINGVPMNTHIRAPLGGENTKTEYHAFISAGVFRFVTLFNPDAKFFNVFFWMPAIIAALAVIPAFFIARKKAGNFGGAVAGILVAINGVFLGRTPAGFSDTDAYNVTFPLFIFWMFLESFEAKDWKKKVIYSTLTGLLVGIYSRTWGGWWFIFDFMLLTMIAYIIFVIVKAVVTQKNLIKGITSQETRTTGISILGIVISSGIFVTITNGIQMFLNAPLSPLRITTIQNAAKADLWPNVFTTVAELNEASLGSIVNQISAGYPIFFFLGCMGLVITMVGVKKISRNDWYLLIGSALVFMLLITDKFLAKGHFVYLAALLIPILAGLLLLLKDKRDIDVKYALFLSIWFIGTIYTSTQGVRFVLLLVPAYSVALGILVGMTYHHLKGWATGTLKMNEWWARGVFTVLVILLLLIPFNAAHNVAKSEVPLINDAWWNSLVKIRENSEEKAIVSSWWDYGHWFKTIADRAVTFDGGSQNSPMAHWIGHTLTTSSEAESVGILRMLNCGSSSGFDTLIMALADAKSTADIKTEITLQGHDLMNEIILQDRKEAAATLKKAGLSAEEIENVLALTHCQPPESFFITSNDMVGKSGVWGHFGLWDFKRAYVNNLVRIEGRSGAEVYPLIEEQFGMNRQEASQLYTEVLTLENEDQANAWISPWPGYASQRPVACTEEKDVVTCKFGIGLGNQQGATIILETVTVDLASPEEAKVMIGFYQDGTGTRIGENADIQPAGVVIGKETLERYPVEKEGLGYDLVLWKTGETYNGLMADPALSTSLFTRLYFMDGAYTERFTKFSDESDPIRGDRIIVWKVNWDE